MRTIKFCSCKQCRAGKHRQNKRKRGAFLANRSLRHETKLALRQERETPVVRSAGYTD